MPGRRTNTGDCFWLLGSPCNLYRIPFDAAQAASRFPQSYTLATFHEAAGALGFKTGSRPLPSDGWEKLPFPCIAFLKPQARNETSHTEAPPAITKLSNKRGGGFRSLWVDGLGWNMHVSPQY